MRSPPGAAAASPSTGASARVWVKTWMGKAYSHQRPWHGEVDSAARDVVLLQSVMHNLVQLLTEAGAATDRCRPPCVCGDGGESAARLRVVSGILGGLLRVLLLRASAGEAEGDSLLEAEGVDAVADPLVLLQVRSAAHGGGARRDAQGRNLDHRRGRLSHGLQRSAGSAQGERLRVCTGKLGGNSNQRLAPGVVARSHYSTHSGGRRT